MRTRPCVVIVGVVHLFWKEYLHIQELIAHVEESLVMLWLQGALVGVLAEFLCSVLVILGGWAFDHVGADLLRKRFLLGLLTVAEGRVLSVLRPATNFPIRQMGAIVLKDARDVGFLRFLISWWLLLLEGHFLDRGIGCHSAGALYLLADCHKVRRHLDEAFWRCDVLGRADAFMALLVHEVCLSSLHSWTLLGDLHYYFPGLVRDLDLILVLHQEATGCHFLPSPRAFRASDCPGRASTAARRVPQGNRASLVQWPFASIFTGSSSDVIHDLLV